MDEKKLEIQYKEACQKLSKLGRDSETPISLSLYSKRVVLILGETSSGKSSLINHVFGIELRRSSLAAEDDKFTIIETISEENFKLFLQKNPNLSSDNNASTNNYTPTSNLFINHNNFLNNYNSAKLKPLSQEELKQPRTLEGETEWFERRKNNLFIPLSGKDCIKRYEAMLKQCGKNIDTLEDYVCGVLVNSSYVSNPGLKDLIIVDTEGFNFDSPTLHVKFKKHLELFDLFYRLSNRVLFLMKAGAQSGAVQALKCLEAILLFHITPLSKRQNMKEKLVGILDNTTKLLVQIQENFLIRFGAGFFNSLVQQEFGDQEKKLYPPALDKVIFVLTQMDRCQERLDAIGQLFQLGIVFGNVFTMGFPKAKNIVPISLPQFGQGISQLNFLNHLQSLAFITEKTSQHKLILREHELQINIQTCLENLSRWNFLKKFWYHGIGSGLEEELKKLDEESKQREKFYEENGNKITLPISKL